MLINNRVLHTFYDQELDTRNSLKKWWEVQENLWHYTDDWINIVGTKPSKLFCTKITLHDCPDRGCLLGSLPYLGVNPGLINSRYQFSYWCNFRCNLTTLTKTFILIILPSNFLICRVVSKMVEFLIILLALPPNKATFLAASGVAVLDLSLKMHKKNAVLLSRINVLLATLI